ncbi:MAG: hypothetical protein ABI716_00995 [Candidatus Saccharibacteria bacterium]
MEKDIIESTVANIPTSRLGEIQKDHEIWEQTDGGAHFKVTRHTLHVAGELEMLALSISGQPTERARIINEFSLVFGIPSSQDVVPDRETNVDIVTWLT